MPFENATTYVNYLKKGNVAEFDRLYDEAVKESEKYLLFPVVLKYFQCAEIHGGRFSGNYPPYLHYQAGQHGP